MTTRGAIFFNSVASLHHFSCFFYTLNLYMNDKRRRHRRRGGNTSKILILPTIRSFVDTQTHVLSSKLAFYGRESLTHVTTDEIIIHFYWMQFLFFHNSYLANSDLHQCLAKWILCLRGFFWLNFINTSKFYRSSFLASFDND